MAVISNLYHYHLQGHYHYCYLCFLDHAAVKYWYWFQWQCFFIFVVIIIVSSSEGNNMTSNYVILFMGYFYFVPLLYLITRSNTLLYLAVVIQPAVFCRTVINGIFTAIFMDQFHAVM